MRELPYTEMISGLQYAKTEREEMIWLEVIGVSVKGTIRMLEGVTFLEAIEVLKGMPEPAPTDRMESLMEEQLKRVLKR